MKIIPLKNFLGKPLRLKTGNVYYEKELDKAIQKYEAQFQSINELNKSENTKTIDEQPNRLLKRYIKNRLLYRRFNK